MKLSIVPMAATLLLAGAALAQQAQTTPRTGRPTGAPRDSAVRPASNTASQPPGPNSAPTATNAENPAPPQFRSGDTLPAPETPQPAPNPAFALPDLPVEQYELTKDDGPFMVMAHVFRGPDATKAAIALVIELRRDYNLPAWVFFQKVQPMHSLVRNVPPTAPDAQKKAELPIPERVRIYDEAAVLVGNCKTLEESVELLHRVKQIHPKCFNEIPTLMPWRKGKGLSRALRTTNPLVPAQFLYPGKGDPLVKQMNSGPFSIYQCPGQYALEVCDFSGRADYNVKNPGAMSPDGLMQSPLREAADNAYKLAEALAKDPEIVKTGYKPYVYHDRFSSKVLLGPFNGPNDPSVAPLRQKILSDGQLQARVAKALASREGRKLIYDTFLIPAVELTDLQQIKK